MPSKRRQRAKGRAKSGRHKDISSEEMDSQPMDQSRACKSKDKLTDIMDRLAKKRLLKSSTDTEVEQPETKENQRKMHGGDGYDADFETSELDSASAGSDMDCQMPPIKLGNPRVVLSPIRGVNRQNTHTSQGNMQRKAVHKQTEKALARGRNAQTVASKTQENSLSQRRTRSKRNHCSTDSTGQPSIPDGGGASGLMSPDMMQAFALHKLNGSDSSTPVSAIADSKSDANESCFGFEVLVSPEQQPLPFSPVLPESPFPVDNEELSPPPSPKDDVTPPPSPSPSLDLVLRLSPSPQREMPSLSSTASSMQSSLATSTSTSGVASRGRQKRRLDVNLAGLIPGNEEQGPPKKAVKKKKTNAKKKEADAWAMKMSAEFDDIEMFELTVE